jgi:rhodanese-related sulfurtransferase
VTISSGSGGQASSLSPREVRAALVTRRELALFDLRDEATFARAHPLFAAQLPLDRLALELPVRVPRRGTPVVVYDGGEGLVGPALERLAELGYTRGYTLEGGLDGWRRAGYELFADVNSYSKAFGELVESRRHTPMLAAEELQGLLAEKADLVVLDVRRFDEYRTMSIPTGISLPGAELVLGVEALAPDPRTTIVINCAGRTRSIVGTESLRNAGIPNRVVALRNGTIGWQLAGLRLEAGQSRRAPGPPGGSASHQTGGRASEAAEEDAAGLRARSRARGVAYRAGVRRLGADELAELVAEPSRTLYRFDVRTPEEAAASPLPGFRNVPGGQLVQETDVFAPVRGARIVLGDPLEVRADMTASWLAQMGWEVYVLDAPALEWARGRAVEDGGSLSSIAAAGSQQGCAEPPARRPDGRYRRPYEGADNPRAAIQAYIDWELGLVAQLERDATHGFFVV